MLDGGVVVVTETAAMSCRATLVSIQDSHVHG